MTIELSIVLVIIGLVLGGVLVGKDLIEAARLRSAMKQIESFDTAVTTFKLKYNGLPGDMYNGPQFGFSVRYGEGPGRGNSDGVLQNDHNAGDSIHVLGTEFVLFWNDLTRANLISEGLDPAIDYTNWSCSVANRPRCFPKSVLNTDRWFIYKRNGLNGYFQQSTIFNDVMPISTLTPAQMFQWDTKIDDGAPLSGRVKALTPDAFNINDATPAVGGCANTSITYNVVGIYQNQVLCAISIRMGFN